jgi:hypothetical protein
MMICSLRPTIWKPVTGRIFPNVDFEMQDDKPWVIGEFVWTGFDYLVNNTLR